MRQMTSRPLMCLLALTAWSSLPSAQTPAPGGATLFQNARLIIGDGSPAIESTDFLIENGRFTRVGRKGPVQAPAGAARVDLTGKTVIPALVDAHSHIGYMKNLTSGPQNYTRENILDHMYRSRTLAWPRARRWAVISARCRSHCAMRSWPARCQEPRAS